MKILNFILYTLLFNCELFGMEPQKTDLDKFISNHVTKIRSSNDINSAIKKVVNYLDYIEQEIEKNQETKIIFAAKNNNKELLKLLLRFDKSEIDKQDLVGNTPLHYAVGKNNQEIIELLLKNCALVNIKNVFAKTSLELASGCGHFFLVKLLIKYSTHQKNIQDAFSSAVCNSNFEIAEYLLKNGAKIENNLKKEGGELIFNIIKNDELPEDIKLKQIIFLLEHGLNINIRDQKGTTPLMKALQNNNSQIAQYLISKNCDLKIINFKMKSALNYAIDHNEPKIAKLLFEKKIDLTEEEKNKYLYDAILNDRHEVLEILLKNNADIDYRRFYISDSLSPLQCAIKNGNIQTLEKILNYDPNFNNNRYKETVLETAKKINDPEKLCKLQQKFFDDYVYNMFKLLENNDFDNFKKYLLKVGSIYIKDINGNNIMHYALKYTDTNFILRILPLCRKLLSQKNKRDLTPIEESLQNEKWKIIRDIYSKLKSKKKQSIQGPPRERKFKGKKVNLKDFFQTQ